MLSFVPNVIESIEEDQEEGRPSSNKAFYYGSSIDLTHMD